MLFGLSADEVRSVGVARVGSVGSGVGSGNRGVAVGVRSASGVDKLGLRLGVGAGAGESHGQHGEEGEL